MFRVRICLVRVTDAEIFPASHAEQSGSAAFCSDMEHVVHCDLMLMLPATGDICYCSTPIRTSTPEVPGHDGYHLRSTGLVRADSSGLTWQIWNTQVAQRFHPGMYEVYIKPIRLKLG